MTDREERMALNVLHQWREFPVCGLTFVPEHIERRSLYNAKKFGLEQVKTFRALLSYKAFIFLQNKTLFSILINL